MTTTRQIRIATYNVHKCRGLDRRVQPERIAEVLGEIDADVVALQEVLSIEGATPADHQARFIAGRLGMAYHIGENRRLLGGAYGNVVLSRLPIGAARNYDISVQRREQRGCLRADVEVGTGEWLHVFNVHLGTAFIERRHQARKLIDTEILHNEELRGPRVMLGDFNEWTRGLASRLLAEHLESLDLRLHTRRRRSYPGVFPLLHLDHIYYDGALKLQGVSIHKSRTALVASDHLPLVADFQF